MEEKEKLEQPTSPQELLRRLDENKRSLHISRVPPKTREAFEKLAVDEFCGDYGMTLKWLMDDIISQDMKLVLAKLEEHEIRIANLEVLVKKATEDKKAVPVTKKMLDGSERVVKS